MFQGVWSFKKEFWIENFPVWLSEESRYGVDRERSGFLSKKVRYSSEDR